MRLMLTIITSRGEEMPFTAAKLRFNTCVWQPQAVEQQQNGCSHENLQPMQPKPHTPSLNFSPNSLCFYDNSCLSLF